MITPREPITDPAFPTFLDVTGTALARTDVEVAQWRSTVEPEDPPYETAHVHVAKSYSGARVEEYRRGTERHFFTVKFGGHLSSGGEVTLYITPAQFDALREAVNGEIVSHYNGQEG